MYKEKHINIKKPKNNTKTSKNQTKTTKNQAKIPKTDKKKQQKIKNAIQYTKFRFHVHDHLKYTPWIHQENVCWRNNSAMIWQHFRGVETHRRKL